MVTSGWEEDIELVMVSSMVNLMVNTFCKWWWPHRRAGKQQPRRQIKYQRKRLTNQVLGRGIVWTRKRPHEWPFAGSDFPSCICIYTRRCWTLNSGHRKILIDEVVHHNGNRIQFYTDYSACDHSLHFFGWKSKQLTVINELKPIRETERSTIS